MPLGRPVCLCQYVFKVAPVSIHSHAVIYGALKNHVLVLQFALPLVLHSPFSDLSSHPTFFFFDPRLGWCPNPSLVDLSSCDTERTKHSYS